MTPEIKNTLIQVLNTAISINKLLQNAGPTRENELSNKQQKLDNAINWVKEQ